MINEKLAAAERVRKFLTERGLMGRLCGNEISSIQLGSPREAVLLADDLAILIAQPAEQAGAGSIGDDEDFWGYVRYWESKPEGQRGDAARLLIDYIDSRPRQAVQQAEDVPMGDAERIERMEGIIERLSDRLVNCTTTVRDAVLEEVALWYSINGWLMDEMDVPDAIRALKSTAPKLADGEGE